MPITQVIAYQCTCWACGTGYRTEYEGEKGLPQIWKKKEDLMDWLNNDENWKYIDGEWFCDNCVTWDDNDELIVKPK